MSETKRIYGGAVMAVLENLEPKKVFEYFEQICRIPHGSGNTKEISDYLVRFAQEHSLAYVQDEMNNVVIFKPGTAGYEDAPAVILQGHMDMVCEKRPDVEHDFEKDGLKLSVENGYIHANGTTLGGDDGIAVAYGLAVLDSTDLSHPPLEVLITVDEEIGLLGAKDFDCSVLKSSRLINLDSEAEGSLWISCAGGVTAVSRIPLRRVEASGMGIRIRISGLMGGHSGAEIDKKRANANLLMGRLLYGMKKHGEYELVCVNGGQKDNAITRECTAKVLIDPQEEADFCEYINWLEERIREEYTGSDENISIEFLPDGKDEEMVLHPVSREKVLFYLMNVPQGIQKMSGSIEDLVETSTNVGIVRTSETEFVASSGVRSSLAAARDAISDRIEYLTEFLGGEFERQGEYPAWEYRKDSPLRDRMVKVYEEMYGEEPAVVAIHAGLECGLFYEKIHNLDCVSLGPDMKDIHTSEERLDVESVRRVWEYLVKVLEELKN